MDKKVIYKTLKLLKQVGTYT